MVKQHHVIIYTGQTPPAPTAQEGPVRVPSGSVDTLRATPIQVTPAHAGSALDPMSRLNLTEHFVIDHHVEVYLFGSVSPQSITALLYQFRDANTPQHPQYAPERPSAGPSTAAGSRRPAGIQTNGDEPNEDQEVVTLLALRVRGFKDPEKARQALANLKRHDEANNRGHVSSCNRISTAHCCRRNSIALKRYLVSANLPIEGYGPRAETYLHIRGSLGS